LPRVSIEIPADILAELDETANEVFASRSAALRIHWKRYMELRTKENTIDTVVHGSARVRTGPHTPDPARSSVSELVSSDINGLLAIWESTEPFSLLKSPSATLAMMQMAFPKADIAAKTAEIAMWWGERDYAPEGRKRKSDERWGIKGIQAGIRGWMGRKGQQSLFKPPTPQSKQQDYSKGVDKKTGRW
jgi:hypothetical protein